jgi:hypothetical protein
MNGFSAQWLQLREPLDALSRAAGLCDFLTEELARQKRQNSRLAIIDLGAGTGANLRYAAPLLGGQQDWLLVEQDPLLLAAMEVRRREWMPPADCRVRHLELDLATQLHRLPLADGALLTASALLDLVSEGWLRALAQLAAKAASPVWFALNYDGNIECVPAEPEDAEVRELFNLHQLTDKGFGPALGPESGRTAERIFAAQGYRIRCAPSDWRIGPQSPALQRALVQGWFGAACEIAPHRAAALRDWAGRRGAHIEGACSELRVGHLDIIAIP